MFQFKVDRDTCIKCGECVAECPYSVIEMVDEFPAINPEKEAQCIECQHCFAVCKPGALSIFGLDPANSKSLKGNFPEPDALETLMLGRRSTRRYKDEPVESELIDHILDVVRNAPTGVNRRTNHFTLVEDQAAMNELRTRTYEELRKVVDAGALPEGLEFFEGIANAWDNGVDILYRGAPHFLVVSGPTDGPSTVPDALIALSYFELLANSHGLGTVWDGLAKWALTAIAPKAGAMLGIPEDHTIGYMMAFGKPAVKFHRTVQRPGGTVNKVTV